MAWEWRGNAGPYFYRSVRHGTRVVREYHGKGIAAELAALRQQRRRLARQAARQAVLDELAQTRPVLTLTGEMDEETKLLAEASMLAAGYRRTNYGRWRKRHVKEDEDVSAADARASGGNCGAAVVDRPGEEGRPDGTAPAPRVS